MPSEHDTCTRNTNIVGLEQCKQLSHCLHGAEVSAPHSQPKPINTPNFHTIFHTSVLKSAKKHSQESLPRPEAKERELTLGQSHNSEELTPKSQF